MTSAPSRSFDKFNYAVRPSKQVERKLFIEALHCLRGGGYQISDYIYVGMGSVYYTDFILFHKYLYINKMICSEWHNVRRRMSFNKPFSFIKLRMQPIGEIWPTLSRRAKHFVWLDYDRVFDRGILEDVDGFARVLSPGSVLVITVEVEPKLPRSEDGDKFSRKERNRKLVRLFKEEFQVLVGHEIRQNDFSETRFPKLITEVIRTRLEDAIGSRDDIEFWQIFNFLYSDGTRMLTVGGIIDSKSKRQDLEKSGIFDFEWVRRGSTPEVISVPPLTIREKHWLDRKITRDASPGAINLDISDDQIRNYKKYYKEYPMFHEALL